MGENPSDVTTTLLTVGYAGHHEPTSLVTALEAAGVRRVVDVRDVPHSRRRGFSKTALAAALAEAGIAYEHERALGNPKPYRDLYRSGRAADGRRAYAAFIRDCSARAVDRLAATLADGRTCLLCLEHDHRDCHRDVIVEELRERTPDLVVEHL